MTSKPIRCTSTWRLCQIPIRARFSDGVVVDYDEHEQIVSLDIQHASSRLDLSRIDVSHLPLPTALAS